MLEGETGGYLGLSDMVSIGDSERPVSKKEGRM